MLKSQAKLCPESVNSWREAGTGSSDDGEVTDKKKPFHFLCYLASDALCLASFASVPFFFYSAFLAKVSVQGELHSIC